MNFFNKLLSLFLLIVIINQAFGFLKGDLPYEKIQEKLNAIDQLYRKGLESVYRKGQEIRSDDNYKYCQPWNGIPQICTNFDLKPGQNIYVDQKNNYQDAYTMATLTSLTYNLVLGSTLLPYDDIPINITNYFIWSAARFTCRTFLRPCIENDNGLELPQQVSKPVCEQFQSVAYKYLLIKYGKTDYFGYGTYQIPFNLDRFPLNNCSNWNDGPLGDRFNISIPSFPLNYTVNNVTVVSYDSQSYEIYKIPGCDTFGFIQIGWICYMTCPTPIFTENQYNTVQVAHYSFASIFLTFSIIFLLLITIFFTKFFTVFQYTPIIMAAFVSIILYAAFLAPGVIGNNEVWCDGNTNFILNNQIKTVDSSSFDSNGQAGIFYIPIAEFEVIGNKGILQGVLLYFSILYIFTLKTITFIVIIAEITIIFLSIITNKRVEQYKCYKFLQYILIDRFEGIPFLTKIKNREYWFYYGGKVLFSTSLYFGIFVIIFSIALGLGTSGNISFSVGQTFNFISNSNKTAIICAFFVPILILLVIDFICYCITISIFIYLEIKIKMTVTTFINLMRIIIYGTIMIIISITISILVLYVSYSTDLINESMSDFIVCYYLKGLSDCPRETSIFTIQIFRDIMILCLVPIMLSVNLFGLILNKCVAIKKIIKKFGFWSSNTNVPGSQMTISTVTVPPMSDSSLNSDSLAISYGKDNNSDSESL